MAQGYDPCTPDVFESLSNMSISGFNVTPILSTSEDLDQDTFISDHKQRHGDNEDEVGENEIFFNPSVCLQRYNRVRDTLIFYLTNTLDISPVTIIEFGCAELRLHQYLKNMTGRVQKLIYVDKDYHTLDGVKQRIRPLAYEFLKKRETPLEVEVYAGCVTQCDPRILNTSPPTFAVIGIEIIEHLDPDILLGFERTIFGLLRPPLVILTTPNSEFNIVFKLPPGKFRHWDHRFEWSRAEFGKWCDGICQQYGGYTYEIFGIGAGTPDTEHLGCVSQMAVFRKIGETSSLGIDTFKDIILPDCYEKLASEDYPFFVDTTPRDEKISNAFKCHISNYILNYSSLQEYRNDQITEVTVPIEAAHYITGVPTDIEDLDEVRMALLKGGFNLQQNPESLAWEILLQVPDEAEDDVNPWFDDDDEEMESEESFVPESRDFAEGKQNTIFESQDDTDWDTEQW